LAPNFESELRK